jgi:hypothetical protein
VCIDLANTWLVYTESPCVHALLQMISFTACFARAGEIKNDATGFT